MHLMTSRHFDISNIGSGVDTYNCLVLCISCLGFVLISYDSIHLNLCLTIISPSFVGSYSWSKNWDAIMQPYKNSPSNMALSIWKHNGIFVRPPWMTSYKHSCKQQIIKFGWKEVPLEGSWPSGIKIEGHCTNWRSQAYCTWYEVISRNKELEDKILSLERYKGITCT